MSMDATHTGALPPEVAALPVPSREAAYQEAIRHLAIQIGSHDQVWIAAESFSEHETAWLIELVRRGSSGRWVRQRFRFDAQSGTLHFRGEQFISAAELAQARAGGHPFPAQA
jgi:hypothetical protein